MPAVISWQAVLENVLSADPSGGADGSLAPLVGGRFAARGQSLLVVRPSSEGMHFK